jgi:YD repeat-containing protein
MTGFKGMGCARPMNGSMRNRLGSTIAFFARNSWKVCILVCSRLDALSTGHVGSGRLVWIAANGAQSDARNLGCDQANNLVSAGNNYGTYQFTLDSANRVTRQVDPFNLTLNFTNDAQGNVTQITDSAGGTLTSVYNADNLLTSRRFSGGPNNAQLRMDVSYTPELQVSTLTRYADTAGTQLLGKTVYAYNNVNQMISATESLGGTQQLQVSISYDVFGNRVEEDVTQSGTTTVTKYAQQVAGLGSGWQGTSAT